MKRYKIPYNPLNFAQKDVVHHFDRVVSHTERLKEASASEGMLANFRKAYHKFWINDHAKNWLYSFKTSLYYEAFYSKHWGNWAKNLPEAYGIADSMHDSMVGVCQ